LEPNLFRACERKNLMAVYTDVDDDDLASFLEDYDIGQLRAYKGIAEGVENTNYFLETTQGKFILTLYERRVSTDDLPYFLSLLEHLSQRNLMCPLPVKTRAGETLSRLAGRSAAIVTFLDGYCHHAPKVRHCSDVGRALAQLHLAGRDFPLQRANALGAAQWRPFFETLQGKAETIQPGLHALLDDELNWLSKAWPNNIPTGVIHADLFPDNVFFIGDQLSGLIDFYFACNDALALDVAICLNAWCFDAEHQFDVAKGRALLAGYQEVRALSEDECRALPALARGAATRFLLTRSYDWLHTSTDALVRPHNPLDYIHRLKFHRTVRDAADYGLDRKT
jgi:homoserine kinase type II